MCGMLPSDVRYASGWGAPSVLNAEKCVVSNIWLEVMLGAVYCGYQLLRRRHTPRPAQVVGSMLVRSF